VSRRVITSLACVAALATACSATEPSVGSTSTTTSPPSTTAARASSTTEPATSSTTTNPDSDEIDGLVFEPATTGPHPAIVLVHGGGWVGGSPRSVSTLGVWLASQGFLVIAPRYQLATRSTPGFPGALEDIACAVRWAAGHPAGDGTVTLVGHSAGAHLAAVVALTGDLYAQECSVDDPATATRLIGLAGPYDIGRLGVIVLPFFGVSPADAPDIWRQGNPLDLVGGTANLAVLLLHGDADRVVDTSFATDFGAALEDAGFEVAVEIIADGGHMTVLDPSAVGGLITAWLAPR
jgi:acetyl esterase/lipase